MSTGRSSCLKMCSYCVFIRFFRESNTASPPVIAYRVGILGRRVFLFAHVIG